MLLSVGDFMRYIKITSFIPSFKYSYALLPVSAWGETWGEASEDWCEDQWTGPVSTSVGTIRERKQNIIIGGAFPGPP